MHFLHAYGGHQDDINRFMEDYIKDASFALEVARDIIYRTQEFDENLFNIGKKESDALTTELLFKCICMDTLNS